MQNIMAHNPVLLAEMLAMLQPVAGGIYVDATFGAGGYSKAILEQAKCKLFGIDRDETVQIYAKALADQYGKDFTFVRGRFSQMDDLLAPYGVVGKVDGVVMDIGISSMQVDQAERGFSFRFEGPLDMRMDKTQGMTAADLVNKLPEADLADIFYYLGEERKARPIAKAIAQQRQQKLFETTQDMAHCVEKIIPRRSAIHPATRVFQALRIVVNQELSELFKGLMAAESLLKKGGRLVVVTFHSLEDRLVKYFFKTRAQPKETAIWDIMTKKPITPSRDEEKQNPRARSAKLRTAMRTSATSRPVDDDVMGLSYPDLMALSGI